LAMSEAEREKELAGVKADAARKKEKAEKEWEEAMATIAPVLVEEDMVRRESEARMEKNDYQK